MPGSGKTPPKPSELQTLFTEAPANLILASTELKLRLLKGKRQWRSAVRDDSSSVCNK